MKRLLALTLALAALTGARAADAKSGAKPELHGVIITASSQRFLLATPGTDHSTWVAVGDEFGPWKLSEYNAKDGILVLKQADGSETDLSLASTNIKAGEEAKASVEDAQRMFEHMHFADMIGKVIDNQKKLVGGQFSQGLKRIQGDATPEEMAAFQQQLADTMWNYVDVKKIQEAAAQVYANSFTPSQLNAIADFYDTPTGQAMQAMAPQMNMQLSKIMMSQIQGAMPQIQQMEKDFAAAHKPGAATPAPAPAK